MTRELRPVSLDEPYLIDGGECSGFGPRDGPQRRRAPFSPPSTELDARKSPSSSPSRSQEQVFFSHMRYANWLILVLRALSADRTVSICDKRIEIFNNKKMLALDTSKKLSFNKLIADGDLVIVYERHDTMKAVNVCEGSVFQNRFGVFKHSDWIGKPFGSKVYSNKSGYVYLLAPSPELWTLVLSHRTQILYIADISFVIMYLEIVPGCLVLESGTGSGSLTTSLARAVAPTGHVYTFDFHEQRAASAREDFERTGVSSVVTVGVRDIQGNGFPDELCGMADAMFLDLPQPWLVIASAAKMLKPDGTLCSFSPCIEQVQRSCEALRMNFTDIRTFEVLLRTYEVREVKNDSMQGHGGSPSQQPPCKRRQTNEGSNKQESISSTIMARPSAEARGHTGYLTFARLKCSA